MSICITFVISSQKNLLHTDLVPHKKFLDNLGLHMRTKCRTNLGCPNHTFARTTNILKTALIECTKNVHHLTWHFRMKNSVTFCTTLGEKSLVKID